MDHSDTHVFAQRPPASALLCIDSEDRYSSLEDKYQNAAANPGNDFRVQKGQPLLYGIFHRVGMVQLQLNYRVPTIVAGVNDTFVIYDSAGNDYYQVTLPEGYYTATSLAAAIQAGVLAIPANPFTGFTCVYTALNGGFVCQTTAVNFAFSTQFNPGPVTDAQLNVFRRAFQTIGASNSNTQAFAAATQILATPQLLFTKYIDITSDRLAKFQRVKDSDTLLTNKTNHIWRVYLTAPGTRVDPTASGGPFDLCVDPNTPKHSMWSIDEAIYELDFRLYDDAGRLLFWTPEYNTEFQITLLASET